MSLDVNPDKSHQKGTGKRFLGNFTFGYINTLANFRKMKKLEFTHEQVFPTVKIP
jgi:hypothetical protein